jgi:long-chain acyl-CoA synthetase
MGADAPPAAGHNLARLGLESFERQGDRESLFFEGTWYRSGALFDRGRRLAAGLGGLGIEPGDRVVVMMPNSPDVGVAYAAIWQAGAVVTPVLFLVPPTELRVLLTDSEARAVITSPEVVDNVLAAAEGAPSVRWVISTGPGRDGVVALDDLAAGDPLDSIVPRADDDLAALLYTGGTTGRSKGVMLSHENLWYCARSAHEASLDPGTSRTLVPLPLAHAFGLIVTLVGWHRTDPQTSALMRWFDPTTFLTLIQDLRMEAATAVPSMLAALLAMPLEDYDLSSLRALACGAAPLPAEVARELAARVPHVELREGYGCTESGAVISSSPAGAVKAGSVGRPLPGYEVRILDEHGAEVPVGERGEICCRSRGVMHGYWRSPDATAAALRDGWLHTGDIGYLDADGYLYIVDRIKDLIIRGGFNVFPRDVEDALMEHPAVAMAGVVGRPDPQRGEEVVAFVALRPGQRATGEELVAFTRDRLAAYKYPREVRILPSFPLTLVGKADRKALRAML